MHELATTRSLVALCEEQAAQAGFSRVAEIRLRVGEMSGVVPQCLEEFFPFAAKGSVCEGARLVCESVPAAFECRDCGHITQGRRWSCPDCGGESLRLVRGREFFVESIAVEEAASEVSGRDETAPLSKSKKENENKEVC